MIRVDTLVAQSTRQLTESGSDSARLDVELILAHILDRDRSWLFTWPEYELSNDQFDHFQKLFSQRLNGKPIAYILGYREFWGLELQCNEHSLIPRPETELLVEIALDLPLPENAKVLDLGTGSGAIALALASEKPEWDIVAIERIPEALQLAQRNASRLKINRIEWLQGSWFEPLEKRSGFDLIVSNPPYVEENSAWLGQGDVRFEPRSALTAGNDGMEDIRTIISGAKNHLTSKGYLLLEHGFEQAALVSSELEKSGFEQIQLIQDLAGLDRATLASAAQ